MNFKILEAASQDASKKLHNASTNTLAAPKSEAQLKRNSSINDPKVKVDNLINKLNMKVSALNAFKSNGYQQCDSKVN